MTDVGAASKKGARGKVVEDLRRQILGCGRATLSYGKPGHALHLTYLTYNHATYGGLVLAGEFCHRGIKGRDTGSPKRANCLHLAAA